MANKQRGLGTGLSALFGEAAISQSESQDFEYLPITKIEPNRDQPRSLFAERPLDELAQSIKTHGVISPLTVRRRGDMFQIIAGERRWRASRMAGLTEVPARIIEADDRTAAELSLVENLQREDLNPIEEALGFKALADDYNLTQDQIAAAMNKSRPVIANAMRLLSLPSEIIESVRIGALAAGSARALLTIPDDTLKIRAAKEITENGLSTRKAEQLAARLMRGGGDSASKRGNTNSSAVYTDFSEAERELTISLGRKVRIHAPNSAGKKADNKKPGTVELEYYDDDDFDELYKLLSRQ